MHEIDAILKKRISPNRRGSDMLDTLFAKFQLFVAGETKAAIIIIVDNVVIESVIPETDFANGLHVESAQNVIKSIRQTPLLAGSERSFGELQKLLCNARLRSPVMVHVEAHIVVPAGVKRRILRRSPMHRGHRMNHRARDYWRRSRRTDRKSTRLNSS